MKANISWILSIGAATLLICGMIWYSNQPGEHDQFAACIADSGATFYGAFWCPHCQEQKAEFGRSAKLLPYTECSTPNGQDQLQVCKDANVQSYPTWEFKDGTRKNGVISLQDLSKLTGCPITAAVN